MAFTLWWEPVRSDDEDWVASPLEHIKLVNSFLRTARMVSADLHYDEKLGYYHRY